MAQNQQSMMNLSCFHVFFLLVDVFLSQISLDLCRIHKFFSRACFSIRSKLSCSTYSCNLDEGTNQDKLVFSADVRREDAEMVMGRLGFSCDPESEELQDRWSSDEFIGLFDEKEPSIEEVKEAFDVFDENRDGFIDAMELQRVLCILGLKEGSDLEKCKRMIGVFDKNADGRIDFNEFVKFMEHSLCSSNL